jgi:hypothetical protein
MPSVKALLDKYGLEDPVKSYKVGVFTDDILQKLYDDLVKEGRKSITDALKVGSTVEDLDIYDLDKLMSETDNQDIKLVYDNLRTGSENHMRAFISQLKQCNATYVPKYINQKECEAILSSSNDNGNH